MKVDSIVSLANGKNYGLLLESQLTEETYYLAVLLKDNSEEPTDEYIVLKEINKDGKTFMQKINNPAVLNELLEDYRIQFEDEYGG